VWWRGCGLNYWVIEEGLKGWLVVVTDVWIGGGLCDTNRCDPFSTAAGVADSLSFMMNPPSTNFRVVCRCKDRGGCGCSRRWPWCFRFFLFGSRAPMSLSVRYLYSVCVVVLWWRW